MEHENNVLIINGIDFLLYILILIVLYIIYN